MSMTKKLEHLTKACLPPAGARLAKRMSVGTRYRSQLAACRAGYRDFGDRYPQTTLFVAGLPKSGTTWLEKMIASYEGFHELMIPEVARYEMRTGGSHDYDLPTDMFERFNDALVLTKMHVHGSEHNASLLKRAGVRYVVLFRDLRDVAVSNYFYVRNTPWHPEHTIYKNTELSDGLRLFAERTLKDYSDWIYSWDRNRDPERSVVVRYEDLLADDAGVLREIAKLFELDASDETVERITKANSFDAMSGGRSQGQANESAFARKGVAGDWQNHFNDELKTLYKDVIGQTLMDFGYEQSLDW
ncbi:MAG: sulfotransferase domain-containing protein [Phycisphaerales bacterium JB047]